jgi:hypothetical protein
MVELVKKSICLDFDGVLHSYTSGWQGATNIPDKPVDGALHFLFNAILKFDVYIYSSRSHKFGGRTAMKKWLTRSYLNLCFTQSSTPDWLRIFINSVDDSSSWDRRTDNSIAYIIANLKFPNYKPSVHLTIDDRAMTFTGHWPSIEAIETFKPWNK